jgi:phenylpropionate dioxygenase-like ring-hydroxylating dioxygenase large terminal subunit
LVFVSINNDIESLEDYLGPMAKHLRLHFPDDQRLEVFHYHRSEIRCNWKLWVDNNSEQYHEYLHILNRKTGLAQPDYHERRWHLYPNCHNVIDQGAMNYGNVGLEARNQGLMPGMQPDALLVMLLFPDVMINVRATVMRLDTITPVAPDRTIVEWRGLGLESDSEQQREIRVRQHNQVWGPAGRNLPEDISAVEAQQISMANGAFRYSIYAREEELRPHDDANLRSFYQEWGRRVGRYPHNNQAYQTAEKNFNLVGVAGE